MCRNIRTLYNFDPPVSDDEIHAAALQYVRKISGYNKPSQANREAFDLAVQQIASASRTLMDSLSTGAPARNREVELEKARRKFHHRRSQ